jgi:hypothetical protein
MIYAWRCFIHGEFTAIIIQADNYKEAQMMLKETMPLCADCTRLSDPEVSRISFVMTLHLPEDIKITKEVHTIGEKHETTKSN